MKKKKHSEYFYKSVEELIKLAKNNIKLQREIFSSIYEIDDDIYKAMEFISQLIIKNNSIYTIREDIKDEMWIYKEGIYIPNGMSYIREQISNILKERYTKRIADEILGKIQVKTYFDKDTFFGTIYKEEIPILDGILNVITRQISPFTPKKIFFSKINIHYNPEAKCPQIINHLKQVLKREDDYKVLFEAIGQLLYGEYFIPKATMFVGDKRNGKSITLRLIQTFIGKENCSAVPLYNLTEDSFSVIELFGKRANIVGDLDYGELKKTGLFKQTTGGDEIGVKRKFRSELKFTNNAKHFFSCNKLPNPYNFDDAVFDRWLIFEFPYKFYPQSELNSLTDEEKNSGNFRLADINHISKLIIQEELDGLFIEALNGLNRLLKQKEFSYSMGTQELKQFWIRKSNSFQAFCIDNIEEEFDSIIPKAELRRAFHYYCQKHKLIGSSDKAIHIILQERYGIEESRTLIGNEQAYVWKGIKFKDNSPYKFISGKLTLEETKP
jgi:putative DNA primase/helicase